MPDTTHYTNCLRIERTDGYVICLTELDKDLVIPDSSIDLVGDDQTYISAAGYTPTNMQSTSDNAVNNQDIEGVLSAVGVQREDIVGGRYDFAKLHIFLWDWKNDVLVKKLGFGHWGEVTLKDGSYVAEFRSLSQQLQQQIGRTYGPECDAQLGDPVRCQIALGLFPKEDGSVTATSTRTVIQDSSVDATDYSSMYVEFISGDNEGDIREILSSTTGSITLVTAFTYDILILDKYVIINTAGETHMTFGEVTSLTDNSKFICTSLNDGPYADDHFNYGKLIFKSGLNDEIHMEVKDFDGATGEFTLFLPMPFQITVGDNFQAFSGCDKKLSTCKNKFANHINFQGFPYIPGVDQISKFGGQ